MKSSALTLLEDVTGGPLTLGRVLDSIVKCDGYTQIRFADTLGISVADLRDIIANRLTVQPSVAAQWAEKLGYGPDTWAQLAWETWGPEAQADRDVQQLDRDEPTNPRMVLWGEGK